MKSDCLDIAIDLSGYTKNNRSHLFEHNISKTKINYLFLVQWEQKIYYIDDKNIIPEEYSSNYSEKASICQKHINHSVQSYLI